VFVIPEKWDRETDVVVVGFGGAGAVTAITLCESDRDVIVLEKAPEPGGSTSAASGSMRCPTDKEKIVKFIKTVGLNTIDEEIAETFAETWIKVPEWLEKHGAQIIVTFSKHKWEGIFPGAEALNKMVRLKRLDKMKGVGRDLFTFLENVVKKHKVEVMLNTPAKRLIQNPTTKEIIGVRAETNGKAIRVKAKRAVVLTCGGFAGNPDLLATYIESAPVPIYVSGTPFNTGDGIKMASDVGAELWHMNGIEWARQGVKISELPAAFWLTPRKWSWINVNRYGQRFRNEGMSYAHTKKHLEVFHYNHLKAEWPNYPWYMIFDEKTRKAGPIIMTRRHQDSAPFGTYNMARELYTWSDDNSKEIRRGWIKQAKTITELADKTGIDSAGLQKTIVKYNAYCKTGFDSDFGRKSKILVPIDTSPYYSVECAVNVINTQGGPKRNARSQIMSVYGMPVPRLYSGGEFGSIWGFFYPGACNLPECIVSGIISGKNAAAEIPWE
jgi:succinate dehydrogenase/fumarate reductase flavoprotein subunit